MSADLSCELLGIGSIRRAWKSLAMCLAHKSREVLLHIHDRDDYNEGRLKSMKLRLYTFEKADLRITEYDNSYTYFTDCQGKHKLDYFRR